MAARRPSLMVAGAVLCGGASTRMGQDKATLVVEGRPLAARSISALREAGAGPIVCVGGDPHLLHPLGVPVVADQWPGQGPLGGILTALGATAADPIAQSSASVTVVLACDLLGVDAAVVERLAAALVAHPEALVAVAVANDETLEDEHGQGARQWLHAAWRADARMLLQAAFDRGVRSIHQAANELPVIEVPLPPRTLTDADLPGDLATEARAKVV
jgi:molybdopterin-guanine dinucleotide biosynthesis protein A